MVNLSLMNLILYNFLENHIKSLIVLHCWDLRSQIEFTNMTMSNDLYIQMWPMNQIKSEENLERRILKHKNPHQAVYFDMNCKSSLNILQKASNEKVLKQQFHWLIYDSTADLENFKGLFKNIHLAVDADVTLAMPNSSLINSPNNLSYILYDVYNNGLDLGGKLNVTIDRELSCNRKECVLKQYLSSLHDKSKYEHRWALRDITMRASTVVTTLPLSASFDKKFALLNSINNKNIDGISRYGFQNLMILKDTLECNFFYNFTNLWSQTETSGGTVGAVGVDNTADISSSPFLYSPNRYKYSQPILEQGYFRQVCVFRTPRNSDIKANVFAHPLSVRVWILFGVALLLTAFLLWLTFLVEFHQMKTYLEFVPSFLTTFLITFGSACCQGSFLIPSSIGGRIVFFTLSLLTFIIYNYYTSIVVAILLGSPVKSNIKTMAQLADSSLEVGLVPMAYTSSYFNFSTLPEIKRFVRNKIQSKRNPDSVWLNVSDGLRRVRDEPGFVFVIESLSHYGLIEKMFTNKEICDLNEVLLRPEQSLYQHLPKNSSYREIIKTKQIRILESGIHRRLELLWVKRLKCDLSSSFFVEVGLEYTAPLFMMLAAVYISVLILMLVEILWRKFENKLKFMKITQDGSG